jgi:hypothetical protein
MPNYFTPDDVCEASGFSPAHVRRLSVAGRIPGAKRSKRPGAHFRYRKIPAYFRWAKYNLQLKDVREQAKLLSERLFPKTPKKRSPTPIATVNSPGGALAQQYPGEPDGSYAQKKQVWLKQLSEVFREDARRHVDAKLPRSTSSVLLASLKQADLEFICAAIPGASAWRKSHMTAREALLLHAAQCDSADLVILNVCLIIGRDLRISSLDAPWVKELHERFLAVPAASRPSFWFRGPIRRGVRRPAE